MTLSQKVFHFCSNLPKNVTNHYPKLYPPKENMLRIVFGTFFEREFGANVKNFLRLSHLQYFLFSVHLLNFNCTNLLVKSLKHSLSLFWCLVADFFPSNKSLRKTLAISIGPWLTVVPIQPCKTICKIFGLGGTWFIAASSSAIFFWTSSIATSMGVKTI